MNLHNNHEEFSQLIAVTADALGIPENAVRRDYYIIMLLQNLQRSSYADNCVFKGGTSLSKCYPGTINRFSEDIDITFVAVNSLQTNNTAKFLRKLRHQYQTVLGWTRLVARETTEIRVHMYGMRQRIRASAG